MFDARIRKVIDPIILPLARMIAKGGISANMLTLSALIPAALTIYALSQEAYHWALAAIIINRIMDGLDGMVARINGPTPMGGYLDIVCDFAFYVMVPIGFGLADPQNLQAAMLLIAAFTITGISFLAYASVSANHAPQNITENMTQNHAADNFGAKAFLYTTGLMEGGETIIFFIIFCLFPSYFILLASIFTGLCIITVLQRSWLAYRTFQ